MRIRSAHLALVASPLFAACEAAGPGDSAPDTGGSPYEPAPYVVEEEEQPTPDFSAEELSTAVVEAIAAAFELRGDPVFPAYFAVMAEQEDGCPDYYEYNGNMYWYDQCTTDSNASYSGYSFYYSYDGYYPGDGLVYDGDVLYGVAQVVDSGGHTFVAGGQAGSITAEAEDGSYKYWQSVVQGGFSYDGPVSRGTWMEDGLAPDLSLLGYYVPSADAHAFVIDGGVSGLLGGFDTVVFSNVLAYDENAGNACANEPGGLISIRDIEGYWYDIVLDGPPDFGDEVDTSKCDGCGTAWYRGQEVGAVCADFSNLIDWGTQPW